MSVEDLDDRIRKLEEEQARIEEEREKLALLKLEKAKQAIGVEGSVELWEQYYDDDQIPYYYNRATGYTLLRLLTS